jgi:hypothetical protein
VGYIAFMPTLLRILKYTPAVVLGLLVAAGLVSFKAHVGCIIGQYGLVGVVRGSIRLDSRFRVVRVPGDFGVPIPIVEPHRLIRFSVGTLSLVRDPLGEIVAWMVPLPLIITAVLPLAIGPFLSYRFRLWHYFAFTALVSVELAYYWRWQE